MSHRLQHRFRNVVLFLTMGAGLVPIAAAQERQPGAQGAVKADITFRPKPHGFNFANWGAGENKHGDLTVDDARCLFGDGVCARITAGRCEPTPAAKMWIAEMNESMGGGHCEGLAALSSAFHEGKRKPQDYGGQTAFDLKVSDPALLRMISTLFVTQGLEPVLSTTQKTKLMSTKQIVDTLAAAMQSKQEAYTLGIYGAEGGHAITPYALEDLGGGRFLIHVYDNNYPGAGNVVEVDTGKDTWRYAAAALNPGEKAEPWEGTGGSMDLTPLSVRFQPLDCPFCATPRSGPMCGATAAPAAAPARPPAAAPRGPSSVDTTANCDQVVVKERKSGKTVAFGNGKAASQIPGAIMTRRRGMRGCTVQLPAGGSYDVSVAGRPGQAAKPTETTVMRPGQVISLDSGAVKPGQSDSIGIGDSSFSFKPAADSKPTIVLATDNRDGKDGRFEIDNLNLGAGHVFSLDERDDGRIVFDSDDPELTTFDVSVRLEDEQGAQELEFDNVAFEDEGQAILGPGEGGGLIFDMDHDSDGIVDGRDTDDDNDGKLDAVDPDDDNDGTPDAREPDVDDADGDGSPDAADVDDDNDGILDTADKDDDNDGVADAADVDDDNDGTPDAQEAGGDEGEDDDADNDGTPDDAGADDDNDGTPDARDNDDDGDGTPDVQEEEEEQEDDASPDDEEEPEGLPARS